MNTITLVLLGTTTLYYGILSAHLSVAKTYRQYLRKTFFFAGFITGIINFGVIINNIVNIDIQFFTLLFCLVSTLVSIIYLLDYTNKFYIRIFSMITVISSLLCLLINL